MFVIYGPYNCLLSISDKCNVASDAQIARVEPDRIIALCDRCFRVVFAWQYY